MNKGTVLALLVVVLGGGYGLGKLVIKDKGNTATASAKIAMPGANEKAPSDGVDRVRVPPEGATKGGANAKVTIVEFSDFQCPFCSRVVPTLHQIEKEYGDKVKVVFRHNPLPFHGDAPLAAEAAVAAQAQGKFWEMHDKLFANQQAIKRPDLEKYAGEIGLDVGKFKAALDSGAGKAQIEADKKVAAQVGANGTPNFYIDGRNVVGAQAPRIVTRGQRRHESGSPAAAKVISRMHWIMDPGCGVRNSLGLEPSQIERPGSPSRTFWRSNGRSPGFHSDAVWTTR